MKQILMIRIDKDFYPLEDLWLSYLFSTFFDFTVKNNIPLYNEEINIKGDLLENFKNDIENSLYNLMKISYKAPSEKQLQKHSSRFEKIALNGKIYKVDYRTSRIGRMAFAINCLINAIEVARVEEKQIFIQYNG